MASGHLILDRASTSVLDLPDLYDKEKWKEARPAIHLCVVASNLGTSENIGQRVIVSEDFKFPSIEVIFELLRHCPFQC